MKVCREASIRLGVQYEKNAKYGTIAMRDVANQFEDKFNDEQIDSYINKDFNFVWRCWKKKTCNKSPRIHNVGSFLSDADIANVFADHFLSFVIRVIFHRTNLFEMVLQIIVHINHELKEWLFRVSDVRFIICNSLKKGKAAGVDNITLQRSMFFYMLTLLLLITVANSI